MKLIRCAECGHDHFYSLTREYARCPIPECPCPMDDGLTVTNIGS